MSLTYSQLEFIQDQLRNNEFASDEEIREILINVGHVPYFYIDEIISYRQIFLTNPLAMLDYECQRIQVRFA